MRDVTHLCVRHVSFTCVMLPICSWDMSHACVCHDSFTCVTVHLTHVNESWRTLSHGTHVNELSWYIHVTHVDESWHTYEGVMADMSRACVCHGSFTYIHANATLSHACVCYSFACITHVNETCVCQSFTWLIHMRDSSHSSVGNHSCKCVEAHAQVWQDPLRCVTRWYVWRDTIKCVTWLPPRTKQHKRQVIAPDHLFVCALRIYVSWLHKYLCTYLCVSCTYAYIFSSLQYFAMIRDVV